MFNSIGTISLKVSDQDRALDFYVNTLGFEKRSDMPMSPEERWLTVAPPGAQTEMNVSYQDAGEVRALRCDLFDEHLARDTSGLDMREAMRLFATIARDNAARRKAGRADWQGIAFALDPAAFAS